MRLRSTRAAGMAFATVAVCAAAGACAPGSRLPPRPAAPRPELAAVHAVWMADTVAPGESLAVRIVGVSGPDGSWTLAGMRREPLAGDPPGVLLSPVVGRVPGDFFIQMEIPLDQVVRIAPGNAGRFTVCVAGRDTNVCAQVNVRAGATRASPEVRLQRAAGGGDVEPVEVRATIRSGWVAALQWADGNGPFRRVDDAQPAGAGLVARLPLRRPPGDGPRRITVQAIDGQGGVSAPAVLNLPAR